MSVGIEVWTPEVLNELEVTVEGEQTGGKEDNADEGGLGFPAKALEKVVWDHDLPVAVVLSGVTVKEEEVHEDADADEDGVVADIVGGGDGVLFE